MQIATNDSRVSASAVSALAATLESYVDVCRAASEDTAYTRGPETALAAPFDEAGLVAIEKVCESFGAPVRLVILVGIGGSDLGARAVYDALVGYADALSRDHAPRLVVLETVEPAALARVKALISMLGKVDEVAMVVVTKSGKTSETLVNANVVFEELGKRFGSEEAHRRTIVVTDHEATLADVCAKRGIHVLHVPRSIGGRFSVFSCAGIVPLALLKLDVSGFLEGARAGVTASVRKGIDNPALHHAASLVAHSVMGARMHDMFVFHPELVTMGLWYRQLLAESVGKTDQAGRRVGIEPSIVLGSTDLHSMGQYVFGGPRDRFTTFVSAPRLWDEGPRVSSEGPFSFDVLAGSPAGHLAHSIYGGTVASYRREALPFIEVELASISARELGACMAFAMASTMYVAKLMDVNAFDQPAVELYKSETRAVLERKAHGSPST